MRLPLNKIYRAFPELDSFSDGACEGFVRQASRRYWLSHIGFAVLAIALGAMVLILWGLLSNVGTAIVPASSPFWDGGFGSALEVVYWIAGPVCAIVTALLVRDHWLRTTIARQLLDTNCPGCGYSMLGLSVVSGAVTCPECGQARRLEETGLSPADLMAREVGRP